MSLTSCPPASRLMSTSVSTDMRRRIERDVLAEYARTSSAPAGGEELPRSRNGLSACDAMDAHTLAAVAAGVSTRDSPKLLDPMPETMDERGTSRSALSRRFVALSRKQMGEFMSRPLGELDIAAVFIDAKYFHEHCVLIALGVDSQGNKHVLGLREGSTENTAVTRALLADLVERGCPPSARCCSSSTGRRRCAGPSWMSTANRPSFSAARCTRCAMCWLTCPSTSTRRLGAACARPCLPRNRRAFGPTGRGSRPESPAGRDARAARWSAALLAAGRKAA